LRTVKGKILVSGGAGYIGSHTVLALREAGYEVVVVDNLSTGQRALVPADVPLIVGDIADKNLVSQVLQDHACMAVLHFAGSSPRPFSISRSNKTPPSDESRPPSNRTCNSLPATGDKPGRYGIVSFMVSRRFSCYRSFGFSTIKLLYFNRLIYAHRLI